MKPFKAISGGVQVRMGGPEIELLVSLLAQLDTLLSDSDDVERDPLADLVGFDLGGADPEPPADPALARLLPKGSDDDEEAREFRRLTERGLRTQKRTNANAATAALMTGLAAGELPTGWRSHLPGAPKGFVIDHQEALALMTSLNDLRLVLSQRLDIQTEEDAQDLQDRLIKAIRERDEADDADDALDDDDLDEDGPGDEPWDPESDGEDPEWVSLAGIYDLLGWWQEALVGALTPSLPPARKS